MHPDAAAPQSSGGRYIVVLEGSTEKPGQVAAAQLADRGGSLDLVYHTALKGYSASGLTPDDVKALRNDPRVKYVEPDAKVQVESQETPTGVRRISAPGNATLDIDEVDDARINVDVAVIDTGIDYTHPDLNVVSRTNCIPADESPGANCVEGSGTDGFGHGTHVAGIIGAIDNKVGVVGVAPGARLWAVRVLNDDGEGYTSWLIGGIDWVTAHAGQIEVANMSVGGPRSAAENAAIKASTEAGVVYAVAAGNDSNDSNQYSPSSSPDAIVVAALSDYDGKAGGTGSPTCTDWGPDETLAEFSNWGSNVDIAAPGVCIKSTWPEGQYAFESGTSMASPHVAGAAAVLASQSNPNSAQDVKAIRQSLIDSATLDWTDTSEDLAPKPLLYMGGKAPSGLEVSTGGWVGLGNEEARLYGAVNARSLEATYKFEYGSTTQYGMSAPMPTRSVEAGNKYLLLNTTLTGLTPNQTYHYRVSATSSSGTVYGRDRTFVASEWSASTLQSSNPLAGEGERTEAVSCASATACSAVGIYFSEGTGGPSAYQRDASGKWQYVAMPMPAGAQYAWPRDVSCTSGSACTAVGFAYMGSGVYRAAAWRWNGASWASQSVPLPSGESPQIVDFQGVSCVSATSCLAVGAYHPVAGGEVNYSALWKEGQWTNLTTPTPQGYAILEGVSCASATACTAVGAVLTENEEQVFGDLRQITRWNGATWSAQTPAQKVGQLFDVSCPSASWCTAVGQDDKGYPTAEAWSGSSWASQTVPAARSGWFRDISCLSSSYCEAVGQQWVSPLSEPSTAVWNGTSWQMEGAIRSPEDAVGELESVSCLLLTGCVSAGDSFHEHWRPAFQQHDDVHTGAPTGVTPSHATLTGTINPGGSSTSYAFEYGATTSYGSKIPASNQSVGSGTTRVAVSQEITELKRESTYHYRLVASNAQGTVYGADRAFSTGTVPHVLRYSFGSFGSGPGQLWAPTGTAVDSSGNVLVADRENNRVVKFSSAGQSLLSFGSKGSGNGQLIAPSALALASNGDVWVVDTENRRIERFNSAGQYVSQFGSSGTGPGKFLSPRDIAIDPSGNIWVTDSPRNVVQEFSSAGSYIRTVGATGDGGGGQTSFFFPTGIATDSAGQVWVVESLGARVKKLSGTGQLLSEFGERGTGAGQLEWPEAIDVMPGGNLLVVDRNQNRVKQFEPNGQYMGHFGENRFANPEGLSATADGVVFVANTAKNEIDMWRQPSPEVHTEAVSTVGNTAATLSGTINPLGLAASYHFDYGLTSSYGNRVPVNNKSAGNGSSPVVVNESVSGLQPNTTYHYRLVALNNNFTSFGEDRTFTTSPSIAPKLSGMAVTEPFNGTSTSKAEFAANWSALGWATGGEANRKGEDTTTGWRPLSGYPEVNGAFYSPVVSSNSSGAGAVSTLGAGPGLSGAYFSLWLDMSTPAATREGYELRFTYVTSNTYNVTLSRWSAGSQTVLATKSGLSLLSGNSFAIADEGNTLSAWTNTGSGFTPLLGACDSSYSSGRAGVEGSGGGTRLTNFKVGNLLDTVSNMNAALNALPIVDSFATTEIPLSEAGRWAALAWDNGVSGFNTGLVSGGWGPYDSYSTINGAYLTKPTIPDTGAGTGAAMTLTVRPQSVSRYFSVWIDMPSPATARTGYELRFTETSANLYEVTLSKWQAGTKTTLASKTGYSFLVGARFALVDKGGTVSAWTKTGSEYTQVLTASDTTFADGYTGLEGSGSITRLKDLAAGPLPPF